MRQPHEGGVSQRCGSNGISKASVECLDNGTSFLQHGDDGMNYNLRCAGISTPQCFVKGANSTLDLLSIAAHLHGALDNK